MLLGGNDKRLRSYWIRGQSLPLTEFQWEVLLSIQGLPGPDTCELLATLNYLLINLASLLLSIGFLQARPILSPWIQSLCLLLAFNRWQSRTPPQDEIGERQSVNPPLIAPCGDFFLVSNSYLLFTAFFLPLSSHIYKLFLISTD
jgi:hypothetical protein